MSAPLGEQREAAVLEHAQLADDAVSATVRAAAAGAGPQLVALDADGIGELQGLDRRVERVRHRYMDRRGCVAVRAGTLAAGDRLVVGEARVSERKVVHRPLPLGRNRYRLSEGGEDDVGHATRGLGVAGDYRRGGPRVDERSGGRADSNRD